MANEFRRVRTLNGLKRMIMNGTHDFFIQLNFGLRSSKMIDYCPENDTFDIENEIDGTIQHLNSAQIMNEELTNIGKAMNLGSLYAY